MIRNVIRAVRLDRSLYAAVESDSTFTVQAVLVVLGSGFIASTASWLGPVDGSVRQVIQETIFGVVGWLTWALVTLVIGRRLFDGTAGYGEMLRGLGFASAPRALFALGTIGTIVGGIWMGVAGIVAVRESLDVGLLESAATIVISVVPWALLYLMITEVVL